MQWRGIANINAPKAAASFVRNEKIFRRALASVSIESRSCGDMVRVWTFLAMAAPLMASTAWAADPALTLTLTPQAPAAGGNIAYLDVSETVDGVSAAKGTPLFKLALVSSNVDAAAIEDLQASDAKGPLNLSPHDDTGQRASRHWSADRDVSGVLAIHYRAPITNAPNARGAAPPFELRTEAGGFSGLGGNFILQPETSPIYNIKTAWNLSAAGPKAVGVSSLGVGDATKASKPDILANSFFMGGNIHRYPDPLPANGFLSVWQGTPPFDARALMQWTGDLYGYYTHFFQQKDNPPYEVFLRRNPVNAGGGVEVGRSFVGTFDKDADTKDFKLTLAHEMVHTFVGGLNDNDEDLSESWYSEGLAVYYERVLPLRAHAITPDDFLTDLNSTAARYYTDLLNDAPNDQIAARFWADTRIRVLPYDRGALYFANLNSEIRKASRGKRSLDDLVQTMIDRKRAGQSSDQAQWVLLLQDALGAAGKQGLDDMLAGKLVLPPSDAFGPCFARTTAPLKRYELGFDTAVLAEPSRIVRGLVVGSAAARAGLRNGDHIVKPVPQDQIQADQHATLTLLIARDGKEFPVTYLPRGETVQAYQWHRVSGVPDSQCDL